MLFGSDREGLEGSLTRSVPSVGRAGPCVTSTPATGHTELKDDLLRFARHRSREDAVFAGWVLAAVRHQVGVEDGYVDTIGWLAWKTGIPRSELRRVVRLAELCELLPATGAAWRSGAVSTAAVEMIAGARVEDCDEQLAAIESEFLDRAKRGDHKTLATLTQHFKRCARADGSKPELPDGVTIADVGDRGVLKGDFTKPGLQTVREALEKFTRPPAANDGTTLAQRQAEGLIRICEVALNRGTDAEGARPVVSYVTHARTADDVTAPLTLGLLSGVIDPRERDRILCDSVIVPVTTDHTGEILNVGRAVTGVEPGHATSARHPQPPLPVARLQHPCRLVRRAPLRALGTRRRDVGRERPAPVSKTSHVPAQPFRLDVHVRPSEVPRAPGRRDRGAPRRVAPRRGLTARGQSVAVRGVRTSVCISPAAS